MKQKVITELGHWQFRNELQKHLDQGWTIVPTTIVNAGDFWLAVVEQPESEYKRAKP
jgi:hypothetical protein